MGSASDRTGRVGVHGVALLITRDLGWKFREQYESDWGIDAIVEIAVDDQPTGQLIALQIKSGDSRLSKLRQTGRWSMYGEKRHLLRWLEYSLPVLIVLYDPDEHLAFWEHVNSRTAAWTPKGFRIEVPINQHLDSSSLTTLRTIAARWSPQRGSARSRALRAVAACIAADVPLPPSQQLWDALIGESGPSRSSDAWTVGLPLVGEAPAVASTARPVALQPGGVAISLESLRGLWSVPAGTTVFVCENRLVMEAAIAELGTSCPPMITLGGFPSLAVDYLMVGLGACGAHLRVHVDHDESGTRIARTLFVRSISFEPWRPGGIECVPGPEEQCLPGLLDDLTANRRMGTLGQ